MRALLLTLLGAVTLLAAATIACTDTVDWPLPTPTPPTPSQVTGVVASAGIAQVTVSWAALDSSEQIATYRVFSATTNWTTWSASLPGAVVDSSDCCQHIADGLENDVTRWFAVTARNQNDAEGLESNHVSARPPGWIGTQQLGTAESDIASGVAVTSDAIYVIGRTIGAFGPEGVFGTNPSSFIFDGFILRVDLAGRLGWIHQFGTSVQDYPTGVAIGSAGMIYLTGWTTGALEGANAGGSDFFLAKYAPDGTRLWIRQFGGSTDDRSHAIAADQNGAVYVAGRTRSDLDGNTNAGFEDAFVTRYDATGNRTWTRTFATAGDDQAYGVAVDQSGSVYVAGYTTGALDGNSNAGGGDLFVGKISSSGVKQWTREIGSTGFDGASAISVDAADNVIACGDSDSGFDSHTNQGSYDVILVKYDSSGAKLWSDEYGGTGQDRCLAIRAHATGFDLGGYFWSPSFDGLTLAGGWDAFVSRYDGETRAWTRSAATPEFEQVNAIDVSTNGNGYSVGQASTLANPQSGGYDVFVLKRDPSGYEQ